jgi:putative transposase
MASRQGVLPFPNGWGGKRKAAGRRPKRRASASHHARPAHHRWQPVHVTLRAVRGLPSLRRQALFSEMRRTFPKTARCWFRLLHYSVQGDHVHLLAEADDKRSLARGVAGLAVRMARAINRLMGRRGPTWACRYHARALATPREVRSALVYILFNFCKHVPGARGLDPCSSAPWFEGWETSPATGPPRDASGSPPVRRPETWLAHTGWKRHGLIGPDEAPNGTLGAGRGYAGTARVLRLASFSNLRRW